MEGDISHIGRIQEVGADYVKVEILSKSACSACHAAGICGASETSRKIVDVRVSDPAGYAVGQEVDVCLKTSMGMKAVVLSYVVPLIVLLILSVSLSRTNLGELYAGMIGLAGVAVYYLVLYQMRDRIAADYVFYIKRK